MSLLNCLKSGANLNGIMEGTVLDRDDPKNAGRVGVFIPRVMSLITESHKKKEESIKTKDTSKIDDANAIAGKADIKGINYLWATPAHLVGENFGDWKIPPVGTTVFVFFLDDDPTQLYYLPFGPGDRNNKPSKAENPDCVVIHESMYGSKIGFTGGEDEEFYVELPDGSGIKINPKEKTILAMTEDSKAKIEMNDSQIKVIADKVILEGNEITFNTPDAMLWMPNIVPNCPLGGFPHGGPQAGIQKLKGGVKTSL